MALNKNQLSKVSNLNSVTGAAGSRQIWLAGPNVMLLWIIVPAASAHRHIWGDSID